MNARSTKQLIVTSPDQIEADIDLNAEHYTDANGERITEASTDAYTTQRAQEVRRGGRPSLGARGSSPAVAFRIPQELRDRADAVAQAEGRTISAIAREQLERYVQSHTPAA